MRSSVRVAYSSTALRSSSQPARSENCRRAAASLGPQQRENALPDPHGQDPAGGPPVRWSASASATARRPCATGFSGSARHSRLMSSSASAMRPASTSTAARVVRRLASSSARASAASMWATASVWSPRRLAAWAPKLSVVRESGACRTTSADRVTTGSISSETATDPFHPA